MRLRTVLRVLLVFAAAGFLVGVGWLAVWFGEISRTPPPPEQAVRDAFEAHVEALRDRDYRAIWRHASRNFRGCFEATLAELKEAPYDDPRWESLGEEAGLTRRDVLFMEADEYYVAWSRGRDRLHPEWTPWAGLESASLENLKIKDLKITGDYASLVVFDGAEYGLWAFEREEGRWCFGVAWLVQPSDWDEPELALPWLERAEPWHQMEGRRVLNVLMDGSLLADGSELPDDALGTFVGGETREVVVRCDGAVRWGRLLEVLARLAAAGEVDLFLGGAPTPGRSCLSADPEERIFASSERRVRVRIAKAGAVLAESGRRWSDVAGRLAEVLGDADHAVLAPRTEPD